MGPFISTPERLQEAARLLAEFFAFSEAGEHAPPSQPRLLSMAQAREIFGVPRKWAVPLREGFDRAGWRRREGDARAAGPRLPLAPEAESH